MNERVKTYRDMMSESGGNLGWCIPIWYKDEAGKIYAGARNEGKEDFANGEPPPDDAWQLFDNKSCECRACTYFAECDAMDEPCYGS